MTTLSWFPEKVPAWGAFTASGQRGLLGKSRDHPPLTILVREMAQNAWDARLPGAQVRFSIDGIEFSSRQMSRLQSELFAQTPPVGLPLAERVSSRRLRALIVRDSNTHGLGGPTRADELPEGAANRYARLLLDTGVDKRAEVEGGTYGFGRSIAYNVSAVRTVLFYTRTRDQLPGPESRFVAVALGDPYTLAGQRYTGRHWWGRQERGSIEPVVGSEADALAASVGFTPFGPDETGTALMILDPLLRTTQPEQAMAFIAESITWQLWPKMVSVGGRDPMVFSVSWNGSDVPVPDPVKLPPLPGFVRALEVAREATEPLVTADGVEIIEIRAQRPQTRLGWLALSRFPFRDRHPSAVLAEDSEENAAYATALPFKGNSSHVVLLRRPELVVTYNQYVAIPDANIEWAGVFLASPEHNEAFARAEPPTHDSWSPGSIHDSLQRRIVNIALREIRNTVNSRYKPVIAGSSAAGGQSVARIANSLGSLFSGIPGSGAGSTLGPGGSRPGGPARHRPDVRVTKFGPAIQGGQRVSEVHFSLTPAAGTTATTVCISLDVAIGDGTTVEGKDRPVGAPTPELLLVEGPVPDTDVRGYSQRTFTVQGSTETSWRVLATAPDDILVSFSINAEPGSGVRPS